MNEASAKLDPLCPSRDRTRVPPTAKPLLILLRHSGSSSDLIFCSFLGSLRSAILFFWPHPQHMEVSRQGLESTPKLPHTSSFWQEQILNPLGHSKTPSQPFGCPCLLPACLACSHCQPHPNSLASSVTSVRMVPPWCRLPTLPFKTVPAMEFLS